MTMKTIHLHCHQQRKYLCYYPIHMNVFYHILHYILVPCNYSSSTELCTSSCNTYHLGCMWWSGSSNICPLVLVLDQALVQEMDQELDQETDQESVLVQVRLLL